MDTIRFKKIDGTFIEVEKSLIKKSISAELIFHNAENYEQARSLWNGMIDKSPSMLVRVTSTQDVQDTVNFAHTHGILLAIISPVKP